MTVNELIEKLKEFPGDLPVIVETTNISDVDRSYAMVSEVNVIGISKYTNSKGLTDRETEHPDRIIELANGERYPLFSRHFDALLIG